MTNTVLLRYGSQPEGELSLDENALNPIKQDKAASPSSTKPIVRLVGEERNSIGGAKRAIRLVMQLSQMKDLQACIGRIKNVHRIAVGREGHIVSGGSRWNIDG
jgi:hypothetical protein